MIEKVQQDPDLYIGSSHSCQCNFEIKKKERISFIFAVVECLAIDVIANGVTNSTNHLYKSTLNVTCHSGYMVPNSKDNEFRCQFVF